MVRDTLKITTPLRNRGFFTLFLIRILPGMVGLGIFQQAFPQSGLNDCAGAIEICGDGFISSNATGTGRQEIDQNNSCSSMEHNSLWIKIEITKPGTLGFTLTPTNPALEVDYDFFIYGPNATCSDLGMAIRCSTTNPIAAMQYDNLTGMKDSVTDLSEGPGSDGDSFVRSLDVLPGESYFIVIDRPIGDGPFDLEWTGTATIGEPPFPEGVEVTQPPDLTRCGFNGSAEFNVAQYQDLINDQPQTAITYYSSLADAIDKNDPITGNFISNEPSKTIFARVENLKTGCYQIVDFDLIIEEDLPVAEQVPYSLCDLDLDGSEKFVLTHLQQKILNGLDPDEYSVSYFSSREEALNHVNEISPSVETEGDEIFARTTENSSGCFNLTVLQLQVEKPEEISRKVLTDLQASPHGVSFRVSGGDGYEYSLNSLTGPYQRQQKFDQVEVGTNMLYIRAREGCALGVFEIVVPGFAPFFSPNGDGQNDTWTVRTGGTAEGGEPVQIFDRYGKLLAQIQLNGRGWDGTFNGRELPADDYWFVFSLNGQKITGHFSLLR